MIKKEQCYTKGQEKESFASLVAIHSNANRRQVAKLTKR